MVYMRCGNIHQRRQGGMENYFLGNNYICNLQSCSGSEGHDVHIFIPLDVCNRNLLDSASHSGYCQSLYRRKVTISFIILFRFICRSCCGRSTRCGRGPCCRIAFQEVTNPIKIT